MLLADLHIHSRYSRATSGDCDAPHLDLWARRKGLSLIGTGDFTHQKWREELRERLVPAEEGLYTLKDSLRLACETADSLTPRFLLSGEISSIYKKNGRTRKVHNLILLPSLEAADALAFRLGQIGNIHSDGRPILGLDSRDLLELTLETCPDAVFIPAHIWTPHFSLFGAFSGFDAIEECFEDLTPEIHALETGLSSDPPMNWRISALDRFTLVSNSDAHSPAKLAREANLLDVSTSYSSVKHAIETGEGFSGTIEFFPEEGKYHLDGHRNCGIRLSPEETASYGGRCPVCGKPVTIGVAHRALALSDRPEGFRPPKSKPFISLAPLPEVIGAALGTSPDSKAAQRLYRKLLGDLGPELTILRETPLDAAEQAAGPAVTACLRRLRNGQVIRTAGYDGEYGSIHFFAPGELASFLGQLALFNTDSEQASMNPQASKTKPQKAQPASSPASSNPAMRDELNPEQTCAVTAEDSAVAVIAGPGTGKTKTLVARIAYLIEALGVKPGEITAVTFTNQAAAEMRERLSARLGKRTEQNLHIGTFHAICLRLLDKRPILSETEALQAMREVLKKVGSGMDAVEALHAVSRIKCGGDPAALDAGVMDAYSVLCRTRGVRDLDDLLLDALALPGKPGKQFRYLLVDEYQDVNAIQRRLIRHWSADGGHLFVIGDPDQSIYGFRGADASCFDALKADFPDLRTIRLRTNYRSTPAIISAALAVIRHNPGGMRTLEAQKPSGASVRLVTADTPFSEGVYIAKEIGRLTGGVDMLSAQSLHANQLEARSFSEIAVLARTHRQLERIESCLSHDGIPCVVSGRGSYLGDETVSRALAFFRALLKRRSLLTAKVALEGAESAPDARYDSFPAETFDAYEPLLMSEPPKTLLSRWSAEYGGNPAFESLLSAAAFFKTMPDFLNTLTLGEEADLRRMSGKGDASGAVRLATLHGAKGLEFPVVFLAGVTAGVLPLERADGCADLAEERRLFYVGMTRARESLILTACEPLSAFIHELPEAVEKSTALSQRRASTGKQLSLF